MRRILGVLLSFTTLLGTSAHDAAIFAFDSGYQVPRLKSHDALNDAIPSLLALRANTDNYLTLKTTDQRTIQALSHYGGPPSPLFGDSSCEKSIKSFIVLEGVSSQTASSLRRDYPENLVALSFATDAFSDEPLAFLSETRPSESGTGYRSCGFNLDMFMSESKSVKAAWECILRDPVLREIPHETSKQLLNQIESAESWTSKSQPVSGLKITFKPQNKLTREALKLLFRDISALTYKGRQVTVLLLPGERNTQQSKRSFSHRNKPPQDTITQVGRRQMPFAIQPATLPVCYSTNSSCTDATDGCSGHGFCVRKYGPKNGGMSSECYACKCQPSLETNADGSTRTIRWGGPACRKRDISSPFFLTAGISIALVSASAAAAWMLFSIGQEQLPGVISAGVGAGKPK